MSSVTYLRHAPRHIQETIADDLEAALDALGWFGPTGVPFGTKPVEFQRRRMDESEMKAVTGNLAAISWGDEPDWEAEELGGGLVSIAHVLFVDVVGVSDPVSLSLASDVKDVLSGADGHSRFHKIRDYTTTPPTEVTGWQAEVEDVIRERPTADWRRFWQTVKATATVYYPGPE
jgi:hypothetical protein